MHGLMPQLPVVRHARAVGPVPSTATAAALFNIEVGRKHGERKKIDLLASMHCYSTAPSSSRLWRVGRRSEPLSLNFRAHEMPTGTHTHAPGPWYSQAQTWVGCRACAASVCMPSAPVVRCIYTAQCRV